MARLRFRISRYTHINIMNKKPEGDKELGSLWRRVFSENNLKPGQKHDSWIDGPISIKVHGTGTLSLDVENRSQTFPQRAQQVKEWYQRRFKEIIQWEREKKAVTAARQKVEDSIQTMTLKSEGAVGGAIGGQGETAAESSSTRRPFKKVKAGSTAATNQPQELEGHQRIQGLWGKMELAKELQSLGTGAFRNGKEYIYKLWKSLLTKWFGIQDCKVYVITPFLDPERLEDVIRIMGSKPGNKAGMLHLYTREKCNKNWDGINETLREVINATSQKLDNDVPLKKLVNEVKPKLAKKHFHGKLIAGVFGNTAEVLVTSANFNGAHFVFPNMETLVFLEIPKEKFMDDYVKSIEI